jgi:PKD domain
MRCSSLRARASSRRQTTVRGPRLRDLSVPTAATVGVASSFAVSPIDAWSPPATTTWDFGDGATATGAAPTHTYATAGNELRSASIEITGQETRRISRWARNVTVDLRGVRLRVVTVRIKARTTAGKLLTDTRLYKTCGRPA